MNCREFEEQVPTTPDALEHLRSCADCSRLSELMEGGIEKDFDPAVAERAKQAILPGIKPVRPVASPTLQTFILVVVTLGIIWLGAILAGVYGFFALNMAERIVIVSTLIAFTGLAARLLASEMIPGSSRMVGPVWLLGAASVAMLAEFLAFFHNYDMSGFVPEGIACLENGLLHAIPVGIAAWLVLRRGFAVEPLNAGIAAGLLAGLGGLGLLELHCPNLKLMHQAVWHLVVVPVSGIVGRLLGWWSGSPAGSGNERF